MPVFFSFAQVREDLAKHIATLTADEVWCWVGKNSIGFHLKHLAGSVDRLTTYLAGSPLNAAQLEFLQHEHDAGDRLPELLQLVERALRGAEEQLLRLDPATLFEGRTVGRRALPTTVLGLLVHLAEHTQRHLGQIITLSQIVRQTA